MRTLPTSMCSMYDSIPLWTIVEGMLIPSAARFCTSVSEMMPPHMLQPFGATHEKFRGSKISTSSSRPLLSAISRRK